MTRECIASSQTLTLHSGCCRNEASPHEQKGTSGTMSFGVGTACTQAMRAIATRIERTICRDKTTSVWGEAWERVALCHHVGSVLNPDNCVYVCELWLCTLQKEVGACTLGKNVAVCTLEKSQRSSSQLVMVEPF